MMQQNDQNPRFVCLCHVGEMEVEGKGKNKKIAKQTEAKKMLEKPPHSDPQTELQVGTSSHLDSGDENAPQLKLPIRKPNINV